MRLGVSPVDSIDADQPGNDRGSPIHDGHAAGFELRRDRSHRVREVLPPDGTELIDRVARPELAVQTLAQVREARIAGSSQGKRHFVVEEPEVSRPSIQPDLSGIRGHTVIQMTS